MKTLNDICHVITCGVAKRPTYVDEGIPFLSSKNVKANRFILDDYNHISYEEYKALTKSNKPEKGDILYTRVGSFGEAAIVDFEFEFAVFVSLTLIKPKLDIVNNKYLMYFLNSPEVKSLANRSTSGIGVQNLNVNVVRKFPILLPPLPQQQKIANILDAADALRQKDKALLAKYDELTQALFLDMFGDPVSNPKGWEIKKMDDFIDKLVDVGSNGGNDWVSKNIQMKDYEDYAIMIRTTNLSKNEFDKNLKFISKETYDLFKKTKVFGGEIIMNKIGSAGDFWIMPNLNRPISLGLNQLMMTFDNLDTLFFYSYFSTEYGKKLIKSKLNGATTKSITKTALRGLEIYYPPNELQNQFAERVQIIEQQKAIAQKSLEKSEQLFNSLLQKAFKGELL
jgi:type I restriction enzyme S subunit